MVHLRSEIGASKGIDNFLGWLKKHLMYNYTIRAFIFKYTWRARAIDGWLSTTRDLPDEDGMTVRENANKGKEPTGSCAVAKRQRSGL